MGRWTVRTCRAFLLSDVGEKVGDYALIEGQPVEWDGERWIWSPWQTLSVFNEDPH